MLLQRPRHDATVAAGSSSSCSSYARPRPRIRRPLDTPDPFTQGDMVSRKRARLSSSTSTYSKSYKHFHLQPHANLQSYSSVTSLDTDLTPLSSVDLRTFSPSPLARTDYFLAGGLDPPSAWREQALEHKLEQEAEQDYRPNRFATASTPTPVEMIEACTLSWSIGRTAWSLAGRLFDFCWQTTFKGFRAGGGAAYTDYAQVVTNPSPETERLIGNEDTKQDLATKSGFVWVEHEDTPTRNTCTKASVAGARQSNSYVRSPGASFASPRSRRGSLAMTHKRPRAMASPPSRRQSMTTAGAYQSPVSPEIEQYQKKQRKEARKQDESIKRLNAQLQDMIREGQQALGSKIEVMDSDFDEGYYDDDMS